MTKLMEGVRYHLRKRNQRNTGESLITQAREFTHGHLDLVLIRRKESMP